MKFVSFLTSDGPTVGLLTPEGVFDLSQAAPRLPRSMKELLVKYGTDLSAVVRNIYTAGSYMNSWRRPNGTSNR